MRYTHVVMEESCSFLKDGDAEEKMKLLNSMIYNYFIVCLQAFNAMKRLCNMVCIFS